jgi:hypothetical protein
MGDAVQQVLEKSLLQAAQTVEQQLDNQLSKLNNLDEDDLESIRRKRLEELKRYDVLLSVDSTSRLCCRESVRSLILCFFIDPEMNLGKMNGSLVDTVSCKKCGRKSFSKR